jgi:hypothetical protein
MILLHHLACSCSISLLQLAVYCMGTAAAYCMYRHVSSEVHMAKLTVSDAARVVRVARTTIQRAIREGRMTKGPDGLIDTAELLRAGYTLHAATDADPAATLHDAAEQQSVLRVQQEHWGLVQQENAVLRTERDLLAEERDHLREELHKAHTEKAQLLALLQSQQCLLEAGTPRQWGVWSQFKIWLFGNTN